jgi:thiamine biosynthesis lipoprotein
MQSLLSSATTSAADGRLTTSDREWSVEPRPYGWFGRFQAMASPCEVHVSGVGRSEAEDVVAAVCAEARRIETKFSRYRRGNVVDRINRAAGRPLQVDYETGRLLDYAAQLRGLSEGRFDITSGVLRRAWTFDGGEAVPSADAIDELLLSVGWDRVKWTNPILEMRSGMEIDLGGIGKEYAVDRAASLVRDQVEHCMINFGGDLVAIGPPRTAEQQSNGWTVGIESLSGGQAAKRISLTTGALATSGDSRRYLIRNGKRFGHILDARSGWPVTNAPRSVTVLASSCTQAGMLATFAMLMGDGAEDFLESQDVTYWCLREH